MPQSRSGFIFDPKDKTHHMTYTETGDSCQRGDSGRRRGSFDSSSFRGSVNLSAAAVVFFPQRRGEAAEIPLQRAGNLSAPLVTA